MSSLQYCYSDYSISSDQRCLVHLGNRIEHLDHVLADLEEQRNLLIHEHQKLKANIVAKRTTNAPFRSLLPEICDIIFAYCCHPVCDLTCDQDNIPESGPLILSAVCRRWRAIVLNNPTLWTTLHHRLLVPTLSNRLKFWLERSAGLPLVFYACPVVAQVYEAATDVMPLIHRMAPHFHRVRHFKSYLAAGFLPLFFSIPMPMLRELDLFVNEMSYRNPPFDASVPLGFLQAQGLQALRVYDLTLIQTAVASVLPCLKSLIIDANTSWTTPWLRPHSFPRLLAQCIFLQSCTINFHPDSNFTLHSLDPIVLPQLESLYVRWPSTFDPSPLFAALRLPNLSTLSLASDSQTDSPSTSPHLISSLAGLIESAAHGLKTLVIDRCPHVVAGDIERFLRPLVSLECLAFDDSSDISALLAAITPSKSAELSSWVCPNLTQVNVTGIRQATTPWLVLRLAERRMDKQDGVPEHGGKFLRTLALPGDLKNVPKQTRMVLLCELRKIHRFVNIGGPFGELLSTLSN